MRQVHLRSIVDPRPMEANAPCNDDFDIVFREDTDAYDEDTGELLFKFRKNVLSHTDLPREVFGNITEEMKPSHSRNSAAGKVDLERLRTIRPDITSIVSTNKMGTHAKVTVNRETERRHWSNRSATLFSHTKQGTTFGAFEEGSLSPLVSRNSFPIAGPM